MLNEYYKYGNHYGHINYHQVNNKLNGAFRSGPVSTGPTQQKMANSLMLPPPPSRARHGLACDVIIRHYMS